MNIAQLRVHRQLEMCNAIDRLTQVKGSSRDTTYRINKCTERAAKLKAIRR